MEGNGKQRTTDYLANLRSNEQVHFVKKFSGNLDGDGRWYRRSDGVGKEDGLKYFGSGQPLRHYESDFIFKPTGARLRESFAEQAEPAPIMKATDNTTQRGFK